MHVFKDAAQPLVTSIRTLFIWIVCTGPLKHSFINAAVRSGKTIVKSAFSQLTYSKTAVKGNIIPVSEL